MYLIIEYPYMKGLFDKLASSKSYFWSISISCWL